MNRTQIKFEDRTCPNCSEVIPYNKPGHFVPPSLGESGFYICAAIKKLDTREKENQADGSKH